ncbi:MAG: DUF3347 domain-containing protein [Chryseolinea sp.]
MKNTLFILALCLVTSIVAIAQHDHSKPAEQTIQAKAPTFKDANVGKAYGLYIQLKDALVASKQDEAKLISGELQKSLLIISAGKSAATEAANIAYASTLADQRKAFSVLSTEISALIKANSLASGHLYLEYCPMANNNEGAYWLSNEKVIKNPYFGQAMLSCGMVKETIQ